VDVLAAAAGVPLAAVEPVASEATAVFVRLGAVLVALAVLARLATRADLSPIPLYLVVGLVLGATGGLDFSGELIDLGSLLGVILLLFMLGLEYSAEELGANLRAGLRPGAFDFALNFTPGLLAGLLLGWDALAAVLLGGVTYISSSGVIAKVLADLGRLGNRETPAVLSILVVEDLAMAVYLPLVAALLVGGGVWAAVGSIAVAVTAAGLVLAFALRYGEHVSRAIEHHSDEVVLLTVLGLVLIVAGAAQELQVSAAVGAFLLGIGLAGQVAEKARQLLAPLRDLFAAAFFLFFGIQIDLGELGGVALAALARAAVTVVTKLATGWIAAKRAGVGVRGRVRAGTALVARGEFSIVIAGLGLAAGREADLAPLAAAYVLLTALGGPLLARASDPLTAAVQRRRAATREPAPVPRGEAALARADDARPGGGPAAGGA
jgi:monovalent cation:H+ antiporter-2, CPA2 family